MDDRKIALYLSRILSGYYTFTYNGRRYKTLYPDAKLKYEAELLLQEELEKNRFESWLREEEILGFLISQGIWTYEHEDFLKTADKKTEAIKVELFKNFKHPKQVKQIRKALRSHQKRYSALYASRHAFDHLTLEGYGEGIKANYLLINSIYDEDNNLCNFDNNQKDLDSVSYIISKSMISTSEFRAIARSNQWAFFWNSNKIGDLFARPVAEWTDEQRLLVSMSRMYDGARDHPDAPDDEVFEDDDAFDGWSIFERDKMKKEKAKSRVEKSLPGKLANAGEIFIAADNDRDAGDIMLLNDAQAAGIIKERERFIRSQDKPVQDCHLPDVQRDLIISSNNQMKSIARKQ